MSDSSGGHIGAITCVHCGDNSGTAVVTGGADGALRLWAVSRRKGNSAKTDEMSRLKYLSDRDTEFGSMQDRGINDMFVAKTLWGHGSAITSICYSFDHGLVVSGGRDGLICVHLAQKGHFVRSMKEVLGASVDNLLLSEVGYLAAHSKESNQLSLFWLNGQFLKSAICPDVATMTLNRPGNVLACGRTTGILELRELSSLTVLCEYDLSSHGGVSSLWFSDDGQFLMAGSSDGSLTILTDTEQRLQHLSAQLMKAPVFGV